MSAAFETALPVQLPYDWDSLADFLARRAIDGVEAFEEGGYRRTLRIDSAGSERGGWVTLHPDLPASCLRLTCSASLRPVAEEVRARMAFLADASCDPQKVQSSLGPLAARHPGLRVPGAVDAFELAVRAILGQQITVRAARTLAGRFATAFGVAIEAPGLSTMFPRVETVAGLRTADIAVLGVIAARAQAIIDIAQAMAEGSIDLRPGADPENGIARLTAIRGVGEWTAQYIALRALGWRDAFPHGDLALRKALGGVSAAEARRASEGWRPLRAYAAMHLWRA